MSLDGIYLKHTVEELKEKLINLRVDKVYQPVKNEIVIIFRARSKSYKLIASCSASNARLHITDNKYENPKQAPMFCMLLRKKLVSSKLIDISQNDFERAVRLDFDSVNELGEKVKISLVVEIMGKYSNIILLENGKILDAVKRVDSNISSKRLVLPKETYQEPPKQDKLSPVDKNKEQIFQRIKNEDSDMLLEKKLLKHIKGVSPIICKEIANLIEDNSDESLKRQIDTLCSYAYEHKAQAYVLLDEKDKAIDLSFMKIDSFKSFAKLKAYSSFCEAMEFYYLERARNERIESKSQNIRKIVKNHIERLNKKLEIQSEEIKKSKTREELRIKADIIEANIHKIAKGESCAVLENFYDNMKKIKIKLDPAKTASQNAQKYYKDYRKSKAREKFLKVETEKAKQEIEYLESVVDLLQRVETEKEIQQIQYELSQEGYMKAVYRKGQKTQEKLKLNEMMIDENFKLLIGKNNKQNDEISLKIAKKDDIWFHSKNIPGSHVVLVTDGREIPDEVLLKAAKLAALNSSAREATKVEVDYTKVKYVKKPKGAKPGKVIYTDYKTLCVSLNEN